MFPGSRPHSKSGTAGTNSAAAIESTELLSPSWIRKEQHSPFRAALIVGPLKQYKKSWCGRQVCETEQLLLLWKKSTEMDASSVVVPGTGEAVGPPLEEHSIVFTTYSQDSQLH